MDTEGLSRPLDPQDSSSDTVLDPKASLSQMGLRLQNNTQKDGLVLIYSFIHSERKQVLRNH